MSFFISLVVIFMAGLVEDFIGAWRTQSVSSGKKLMSFLSGLVYTLIYATVLTRIVDSVLHYKHAIFLIIVYAIGSGVGNLLLVWVSRRRQ